MTAAQQRLLEVIRRMGGTDEGAEYWPAVNEWVRDTGNAGHLALHNIHRTVEALIRDGHVTVNEDGYFLLTERAS